MDDRYIVRLEYGKWAVGSLATFTVFATLPMAIGIGTPRSLPIAFDLVLILGGCTGGLALWVVRPMLRVEGELVRVRQPLSTRMIACADIEKLRVGYFGYLHLRDGSVIQTWALQVAQIQLTRSRWARADYKAERLARVISSVSGKAVAVDHGSRRPPPPPTAFA